jgi:hypothetical protein
MVASMMIMMMLVLAHTASASDVCRVCQVDEDCLTETTTNSSSNNNETTVLSYSLLAVRFICDTERQLCVTEEQNVVENQCPCSSNDDCASGRCIELESFFICQAPKLQDYEGCNFDSDCINGMCDQSNSVCYNETIQGGPYQPWTFPPNPQPLCVDDDVGTNNKNREEGCSCSRSTECLSGACWTGRCTAPTTTGSNKNNSDDDGSTDGMLVGLLVGSSFLILVIFVWCSNQTARRADGQPPMIFGVASTSTDLCCCCCETAATNGGGGIGVGVGAGRGGGIGVGVGGVGRAPDCSSVGGTTAAGSTRGGDGDCCCCDGDGGGGVDGGGCDGGDCCC